MKILDFCLMLLFASTSTISWSQDVKLVPQDYPALSAAFSRVEHNAAVLVDDGFYYEKLKRPEKDNSRLKGLNGNLNTIIDGR